MAAARAPPSASFTCAIFRTARPSPVEPWRARAFPTVKDLIVDRTAFDRIMLAGGFISVNIGNAPEANALPVSKEIADLAMDAAACIGCGACVAVCKTPARCFSLRRGFPSQLSPAGIGREGPPRQKHGGADGSGKGSAIAPSPASCEAVCPKEISLDFIAKMNRDYAVAVVKGELKVNGGGVG